MYNDSISEPQYICKIANLADEVHYMESSCVCLSSFLCCLVVFLLRLGLD